MTHVVVDADVVAACLLGEAGRAQEANAVLEAGDALSAPDYLRVEVANVVWKAALQGRLPIDGMSRALAAVESLGIDWNPTVELLDAATRRAIALRHPVYDMLYVELAGRRDAIVVSFDTRLQAVCPDRVLSPAAWSARFGGVSTG